MEKHSGALFIQATEIIPKGLMQMQVYVCFGI